MITIKNVVDCPIDNSWSFHLNVDGIEMGGNFDPETDKVRAWVSNFEVKLDLDTILAIRVKLARYANSEEGRELLWF